MNLLIAYAARVVPGLLLAALVFAVIRPHAPTRVGLYIVAFVFLRDTMAAIGLWSFGSAGLFWMRFAPAPTVLFVLGTGSAIVAGALSVFDHPNRRYLHWFLEGPGTGLTVGAVGAAVVVIPLAAIYLTVPLEARGGEVGPSFLFPVAAIAFLGGLLEEGLFRGYVLGYLARTRTRLRAGVLSGLVFACCHVFLASTVTDVGIPLLVFTLWEGVIAGMVGSRYGIIPATVTHGGAVFVLASGLL